MTMRIRITFSKQGALRYTGHLDLHKIIERSIRRADLPLAYSLGYHPQPKLNLAAALPLGFASRAEVMDIWLNEDRQDVLPALQANVPPGLTILQVEQVDERKPSLQTQVVSAEYQVEILEESPRPEPARPGRAERAGDEGRSHNNTGPSTSSGPDLNEKIASVLESASLPRERRGKNYDLRPLIEELTPFTPSPSPSGGGEKIFMRLAAREGATGRPEEVLEVLGIPLETTRIERTRLIFKS